jgi:hypothetical protein
MHHHLHHLLELNLWAVLVAALSSFASGGLWFSPMAFGRLQAREMRKRGATAPTAGPRILILSFALCLIETAALASVLGPAPGFSYAIGLGVLVGACFAATGTAINYLYTGRGWTLTLIDGGYHVTRFVIYAAVLGTWG